MKKILMGLAVALGFAVVANADAKVTTFEQSWYTEGQQLAVSNDDYGVDFNAEGFAGLVWKATNLDVADTVISNGYSYTKSDTYPFSTGDKYLKMDSGAGRLERYANPCGEEDAACSTQENPDTVTSDGYYVDTLVKFTAADEPNFNLDAGVDKIAITYIENDDTGMTNFVVRAGYVESGITPTNYVMNLPADFNKDDWHRLTIRAIKNLESAVAPLAFVVYIDEEALTYSTDVAAGNAAFVEKISTVGGNFYNADLHALLPSLVGSGSTDGGITVTSAGFAGSGSVDNIAFSSGLPEFVNEATSIKLKWGKGVASIEIQALGFSTNGLADSGEVELVLPAGVFAISPVATYATGYVDGEWTASPGGVTVTQPTDGAGAFDGLVAGAVCEINAMLPLFEVNGVGYDYIDDAVVAAAAASAQSGDYVTIKLLADYDGSYDGVGVTFELTEGKIILDLAGKNLVAWSGSAIINSGADLIITNSTTTIGHVGDEYCSALLVGNVGTTVIYGGQFDSSIEFDIDAAAAKDVLQIYGGTFYDARYDEAPESVFYLADDDFECNVIAEGVGYTYDGGNYFTVGTPPEPGEDKTVTIEASDYASVSYKLDAALEYVAYTEAVTVADGATLYVKCEITNDAYEFDSEALSGWSIVGAVATKALPYALLTDGGEVSLPAIKAKQVEPTMWAVTFSTNDVPVAEAETEVEDGGTLASNQIPEFEGGAWDVDPTNAVITCATNFNYTIQEPEPTTVDITIPSVVEGGAYIVSNATEQITASSSDAGGSVYTLTIGESYKIYAVAAADYEVVGTNPYDIGVVAADTTVDTAKLPTFQAVTPTPSWDIPGTTGGIQAIGEGDAKHVEFSSIAITATGATVGLKAGKIDADGETFGLICKTDLTKADTIVINATMAAEKDAETGTFTITADLSGYTQLFVVGVGPAAVTE